MPMSEGTRPRAVDPPTAFTILHTWLSWSDRPTRPLEAHACGQDARLQETMDHRHLEEEEEGPGAGSRRGRVAASPLDRYTMAVLQSMVFRTAVLLLHHTRRFLSWYTLQAWKRNGEDAARMHRSSPLGWPEEEEVVVVGSSSRTPTHGGGGGRRFLTDALTWKHLWPFLTSPHRTAPAVPPTDRVTSPTCGTASTTTWEKCLAAFTVDTFAMWCRTASASSSVSPPPPPLCHESRTRWGASPSRSSASSSSFFPFFPSWCGRGYALGCPLLDTRLCASTAASPWSSSAVGGSALRSSGERSDPLSHPHDHYRDMRVAVRMGMVTELSGEAGSGKTQWLLQLLCTEAARYVVGRAVWQVGMAMMRTEEAEEEGTAHPKKSKDTQTKSDRGKGGGATTSPRHGPSPSRHLSAETTHHHHHHHPSPSPPQNTINGDANACPTSVPSREPPAWQQMDWKRQLAAWESDVFARLPSLRATNRHAQAGPLPVPPSPLPRPLVYLVAEDLPMPRLAQIAAGCIRKMIALYFGDEGWPPCRPVARRPLTPTTPPQKKKEEAAEEDTPTPLARASGSSSRSSWPFCRPTPPPLFSHGILPYAVVSQWKRNVQHRVTVADVLSTILIYKIRHGLQELHDLVQMGGSEAYPDHEEEEEEKIKREETQEDDGNGAWRRKRNECGELVKLFRHRHAFLVQSDKEAGQRRNAREWEVERSGGLVIIDSIAAAAQQSRLAEDEREEAEKTLPRRSYRKMEHRERETEIEEDAEDEDHQWEAEEEEEVEEGVPFTTPRCRSRRRASMTQAALLREVGVGLRDMSQAFGVAVIVSNQIRSVFSPPHAPSSSSSSLDTSALDAREWRREAPPHPFTVEEAETKKMRGKGENTREEDTSSSTTTRMRSLSSPHQWFSMISSSSFSSSTTTTPLGWTWGSIPHVRLRLYRERVLGPMTPSLPTWTRASPSCVPTRPPRMPTPTPSSLVSNRTMMTITNGTIARPSAEEKDGEREVEKDAMELFLPTSSSSGVAGSVPPRPTDLRWVEVCQSPYLPKGLRIPFAITTDGVEGVYMES